METKVEVTFQLDSNGMLRVSAMEPATGKQTEITVRNYSEVAQSKGAVKAKVDRSPGAKAPSDVGPVSPGESTSATDDTPAATPTKKSKKTKKVKKSSSDSGGGLLSALFGRKRQKNSEERR
jgi:molecular chaperone DnaK (HSP70)